MPGWKMVSLATSTALVSSPMRPVTPMTPQLRAPMTTSSTASQSHPFVFMNQERTLRSFVMCWLQDGIVTIPEGAASTGRRRSQHGVRERVGEYRRVITTSACTVGGLPADSRRWTAPVLRGDHTDSRGAVEWSRPAPSSSRDRRLAGGKTERTSTRLLEHRILLSSHPQPPSMSRRRKPDWLKTQPPAGKEFTDIKQTLRDHDLHTVCEEANCPNLGECWSGRNRASPSSGDGSDDAGGTATFMLMGDHCTRNCNFCDVATGGGQPL